MSDSSSQERVQALVAALEQRILVLDGATGTAMQDADLTAEDFGGEELDGCNEILVETRPDVVRLVHDRYLAAGADIVETNTFGGTPLVLDEYGLGDRARELNRVAASIARQACDAASSNERPRFVCGSMGPTTKAISVTGGVTFEELVANFREQALGLIEGGADYLLLETSQDTRNIKAGLIGIREAFASLDTRIPIAVSATIEAMGTMLGGQDAEAFAISMMHEDLLYVGLNCATGPAFMTDYVRTLAELCRTRVAVVPNAGLPDENGVYLEGPEVFEEVFGRFLEAGWINLVGGCCGTTEAHVAKLADMVSRYEPREIPEHQRALVSGLEGVELTADNRPLLVGERTNVLGSRKFKRLIQAGDFEAASEVGRAQVRGGAQVIDICLQDPDRDEIADMERFLDQLIRRVKVPLMIDSTDALVMERALTYCQGKSILNSINLEDGLLRFEQVTPLARRFGAALVVGLIDEEGMAVSVERKLAVARRSFQLLTEDFGIDPADIWWDALVFPCGTGDENYLGSAAATIEGVRRLKEEFPATKTILGVSNVSFGLPNAGREVLNSVFLYRATQAGLDAAIVNTEKLARFADIPAEERELAQLLIDLEPGDAEAGRVAVERFTESFRGQRSRAVSVDRAQLPLAERLQRSVIEGSKEGLIEDLEAALEDPAWPEPLDVINGPLMAGMAEVGRLFNANELIVAEVLQSAEVMKAAVSFLEGHMERSAGSIKGKVLLATVKGDVHDIGKNLVDIILSNNGFEVINLGIKVPSERLIQAVGEHRPDVVGLSGLLVKSAQMMVTTAADFKAAGIEVDLLVGGAALTRRFTHNRIAAEYGGFCTYAKDAMHGLELVEQLTDPKRRDEQLPRLRATIEADRQTPLAERPQAGSTTSAVRSSKVRSNLPAPAPAHLDRQVEELDLDEIWELVNPQMLYGKHLGLRGSVEKLRERGDEKFQQLQRRVDEIKDHCRRGGMRVRAVWQFFPAHAEGNRIVLSHNGTDGVAHWDFPRQSAADGLCLADYVMSNDHIGLFVTTAGAGVREQVEEWRRSGEYVKSHVLAALALETAEAAAEWVHRRLRGAWGFPDEASLGARELLTAKYRGKRYSFGYPACPDLDGQKPLFDLLDPAEIGVELTEGQMMDPEASVSALVFHHPDAKYFAV